VNVRNILSVATKVAIVWFLLAYLFTVDGSVRGAQDVSDTISAPVQVYLDEWNLAANGDDPIPSSEAVEAELSAIWMDTVSGSECEKFAGVALGAVTLMGIYGETDDAAYLGGAVVLLEALDAIEYACLIEA